MKRIHHLLYPKVSRTLVSFLAVTVLLIAVAGSVAARQSVIQANSMGPQYANWLHEDAAYIITNAERAKFQQLPTDKDRDKFIEQFWLRRDPPALPRIRLSMNITAVLHLSIYISRQANKGGSLTAVASTSCTGRLTRSTHMLEKRVMPFKSGVIVISKASAATGWLLLLMRLGTAISSLRPGTVSAINRQLIVDLGNAGFIWQY